MRAAFFITVRGPQAHPDRSEPAPTGVMKPMKRFVLALTMLAPLAAADSFSGTVVDVMCRQPACGRLCDDRCSGGAKGAQSEPVGEAQAQRGERAGVEEIAP